MGDTDFPAMMGNQPIGFLQQFVKGNKMYSQKGDNVPAFTNTMGYSQQMGGPLVAHGSHKPAFIFDEIPRYVGVEIDPKTGEKLPRHNPADHKGPVDPSGKEIKELRPEDKDIPLSKTKMLLKSFIG